MKKMNNKRGFTLAELLIVVAIIAVLVAVAIPVFSTQLEKSREATDLANLRSAYAEAVAEYLGNGSTGTGTSSTYSVNQKDSGWSISTDNLDSDLNTAAADLKTAESGDFTVTYDGTTITVTVS